MPTVCDVFEQYMAANPNRSKRTNRHLGDWLTRPLDAIGRADVEARFNGITADHGWSAANRAMSLLRLIYRRPCVDHEGLRNPVDLWLAGGGKFHRKARHKISALSEVLPCWRTGIKAEVNNPAIHDALWFGLYTGMRQTEMLTLRWERVDMDALTFRVEETKTGVPLEPPISDQLAAILERRACLDLAEDGVGDRRTAGDVFRVLVEFQIPQGRVDLVPLPAEFLYRLRQGVLDETPIGPVRAIVLLGACAAETSLFE